MEQALGLRPAPTRGELCALSDTRGDSIMPRERGRGLGRGRGTGETDVSAAPVLELELQLLACRRVLLRDLSVREIVTPAKGSEGCWESFSPEGWEVLDRGRGLAVEEAGLGGSVETSGRDTLNSAKKDGSAAFSVGLNGESEPLPSLLIVLCR